MGLVGRGINYIIECVIHTIQLSILRIRTVGLVGRGIRTRLLDICKVLHD